MVNRKALSGIGGLMVASLMLAGEANARDDQPPSFNSLRTPTSPAFTLLGIEPTSVERPNTPSSLAASLLNQTAGFSTLPRDYALEFSPYWLVGHPRLTWRDDSRRGLGASI